MSKAGLAAVRGMYAQPGVVNRDYEGEIRNGGDTVRIKSLNRPTIGTYTKNSTTISPETPWLSICSRHSRS